MQTHATTYDDISLDVLYSVDDSGPYIEEVHHAGVDVWPILKQSVLDSLQSEIEAAYAQSILDANDALDEDIFEARLDQQVEQWR